MENASEPRWATDPFFRFVDGQLQTGNGPPVSVPEPGTLSLLLAGLLGLFGARARTRKRRSAL